MTPENDLNRILAALREAEPTPDLNHRILTHLEQSPKPARQPSWFAWPPLQTSFATAVAAAAIMAVAITLTIHHTQTKTPSSHSPTLSSRPKAAPYAAAVERSAVPATTANPTQHPNQTQPRLGIGEADRSRPSPRSQQPPPNQLLCDCDPLAALALAEANAPSQPSPPLPLTKEERLLQRVARHPDTIELAELNPLRRAAASTREQADFKQFFAPPPLSPEAIEILNHGAQ